MFKMTWSGRFVAPGMFFLHRPHSIHASIVYRRALMALEGESEPVYLRERFCRKQRSRNRRVHPLLPHGTKNLHACGRCFEPTTQAPAGFQEQSQEEDHVDRLSDYADMQANLEVRRFRRLIWRMCNVAYDAHSAKGRSTIEMRCLLCAVAYSR